MKDIYKELKLTNYVVFDLETTGTDYFVDKIIEIAGIKYENGEEKAHTYELKNRERDSNEYQGFDSSDVIYLITPDRFQTLFVQSIPPWRNQHYNDPF